MSVQGEVGIERAMAFVARQKRQSEWVALKEYWRADEEDKPIVMSLYKQTLVRALEKWNNRKHKA